LAWYARNKTRRDVLDRPVCLSRAASLNIETAVQAKKTQSVGRPVVQNLRGALSAHESGLPVTSGNFTDVAEEEARDLTKAPIALIDGRKLVDLLLEHEIGAKQKIYKVYTLEPESLSLENLKARTELLTDAVD